MSSEWFAAESVVWIHLSAAAALINMNSLSGS